IEDTTFQAHLLVHDPNPPGFSLVFFGDDKPIRLVSDISKYTPNFSMVYPGHQLIAAWVHSSTASRADAGEVTLAYLKDADLLSAEATLEKFEMRPVPRVKIPENEIPSVNRRTRPYIEFLD